MARGKYAKKRLMKELRASQVRDAKLSAHTIKALENAGIMTLADLALSNEKEIRSIHGIGPKAIAEICELRSENRLQRIIASVNDL